jgi:hypothetical protein
MAKYQEIRDDYLQAYQDAYNGWSGFLSAADDNMRFFLGDQLSGAEKHKNTG